VGFRVGKSAVLYNPVTDTSVYTGSLSTERVFHTATLLSNGKVLVAGGDDGNTAELYDPVTGTWSPTGSLGTNQWVQTATLLPSGKVLAVGGATAELYDPATGTWSSTASPDTSGTATLLPNGKVLVVGGTTAELYDSATGTWSFAGSPVGPLNDQTAILLSNGQVLLPASAELYVSFLNPILNASRLGDGSFQFGFNNPSGVGYRVLASPNPAAPLNSWSNLGSATETSPGSGQFQFTDYQATNHPQRFYRVSSP
jgi:hypothetical protein